MGLFVLMFSPLQALAAEDEAGLRDLVARQAGEIEDLKARLAALETAVGRAAAAPAAKPVAAQAPPTTAATVINWGRTVPELINPERQLSFRPKGRMLADASTTWGSEHPARNISGTELRALRLGFEGGLGPSLAYAFEVDFADNNASVKGAYLAWRDRWDGTDIEVSLGNRLSERSIEGSSSSEATPFMERNAVASAITPLKGFYGLGVLGKAYGPSWHLAAQVAGDDVSGGEARDTLTYMLRGHWNPVRSAGAAIHLGGWGFYEAYPAGMASLSRSSLWGGHFNDNVQVPLGAIGGPDRGYGYGLELGGVRGPLWSFLEAGRRTIDAAGGRVEIDAWALSAGWILTGEGAPYSPRGGTFVRIAPNAPLSKGGLGSLELTARYQGLDNRAPLGGEGREATLGATWRLEDWMRVMLNLSLWEVRHPSGPYGGPDDGATLASRLQLSF
ncbi:porin [Phenylobacterium sp. LjRoot164]|uniref:OprO/OprP family phosphate-selective porin n=1 Tax=unclassified Phenylobacterium TaxID=2640670 RepID=UPI003ED07437